MIEGTLLPRSFGLKSLAFAGSTRLKDRLFALLHLKSCLLYRRIEENRDHVIHPANVKRPKFEKVKRKNRELASSANSWIFATEHQKVVRFWAFMLFTTSRNSAQQSRNGWIRSFKIQRSCWKGLHCYYKIKFRHWWPSHLFNIGWACLSCFPRETSKSIKKSRDLLPDPLKIHKGD